MIDYMYTTYVISPLSSVVHVKGYEDMEVYNFRFRIKESFSKYSINILDPVDMEKVNVGMSVEKFSAICYELKKLGELEDLAKLVAPITQADLKYVRASDFLIGYFHKDYPTIGAIDELSEARRCNIPAYIMIEGVEDISAWLIDMIYNAGGGRAFVGKNRVKDCITYIENRYFKGQDNERLKIIEKYKKKGVI